MANGLSSHQTACHHPSMLRATLRSAAPAAAISAGLWGRQGAAGAIDIAGMTSRIMACRWGQLTLANNPNGRTSQASPYRTARPTGRPRSLNMLRAHMSSSNGLAHLVRSLHGGACSCDRVLVDLSHLSTVRKACHSRHEQQEMRDPGGTALRASIAVIFTAATKTSVAHLEFINALAPIVLAPLGFLFFRERPQWKALRWGVFSLRELQSCCHSAQQMVLQPLRVTSSSLLRSGISRYLLLTKRAGPRCDHRRFHGSDDASCDGCCDTGRPSHRIRCVYSRQPEDLGVNLYPCGTHRSDRPQSARVRPEDRSHRHHQHDPGGPTGTVDISCMGISRRDHLDNQAHGALLVIIGSILVVITGKRSMENTEKFTVVAVTTPSSTRRRGAHSRNQR